MKMNEKYKKKYIDSLQPGDEQYINMITSIGERIFQIMKKKSITEDDIGNILKINDVEVIRMLSGHRNLTLYDINKMEMILGEKIINITQD